MNNEKHEGYKNRETWALALHLNNDEGLYLRCREMVKGKELNRDLEQEFMDFIDELKEAHEENPKNEALKLMFDDVGSLWRVDIVEVIEDFMDKE